MVVNDNLTGHISVDTPMKYILVTGGSISGLGKGVTVCALGSLLCSLGLRVTAVKIDPYLNIDAGTMSPYEHGEVFVLEDGGEVDLDLGNYERAFGACLTKQHNLTTGKIYNQIISAERKGEYLGKTVQIVPHVTDAIKDWLESVSQIPITSDRQKPNICIVEIGGTVGDIESIIYLEALAEFKNKIGTENFVSCHLTYVPLTGSMNQQKTKPTQHSAKAVLHSGLNLDFILCRCEQPLLASTKNKIALYSPVNSNRVISLHNVNDIHEIPLIMAEQNLHIFICERLKIPLVPSKINGVNSINPISLSSYNDLIMRRKNSKQVVTIGIVGKYTGSEDSYFSVVKSLEHACLEALVRLNIVWVDSTNLEFPEDSPQFIKSWDQLKTCNGVLCPGGFGDRGFYGKSLSARLCRKYNIPYFGICLGLQTAVIDFANDVLGLKDANSLEFDPNCQNPVIISMPEYDDKMKGGTMRLGLRRSLFVTSNSLAYKLYDQKKVIFERHRHRFEVNPVYIDQFENHGFKFVAKCELGKRMEIAELENHPFFICSQFHPEFQTKATRPTPLFLGFILASLNRLQDRLEKTGGFLYPGKEFLQT